MRFLSVVFTLLLLLVAVQLAAVLKRSRKTPVIDHSMSKASREVTARESLNL